MSGLCLYRCTDGSFYAVLGPVASDGTLSQTLATNFYSRALTFRLWLNAVGSDPVTQTESWDGTSLFSQTDPNTGGNWTLESFTVTGTGSNTVDQAPR